MKVFDIIIVYSLIYLRGEFVIENFEGIVGRNFMDDNIMFLFFIGNVNIGVS